MTRAKQLFFPPSEECREVAQLPLDENTRQREVAYGIAACARCGRLGDFDDRTFDNTLGEPTAPDPCLGYLPGVLAACCGHGKGLGYIWFENGVCVSFDSCTIDLHPQVGLRCYGPRRDTPADIQQNAPRPCKRSAP